MSGAALVIGALVLCYVDGPAAYVRVTGHAVVVANVFSVHRIPRTSIDRVGGYENLGVYLFLNDGKKVSVTAFQPSISPGNRSHRQYVRRGRQLERALESIPAAVEQPSYRRRLRYSNILLMLGAIALLAVTYFWALPQINEL